MRYVFMDCCVIDSLLTCGFGSRASVEYFAQTLIGAELYLSLNKHTYQS